MTQKKIIILAGILTADPDIMYAHDETAVCHFTLKYQDGATKKETEIQCVAFGGLAKVSGEYLKKGKLVAVEGKLQTKSFVGKTGKASTRTELVVRDLQMLDDKFYSRKRSAESQGKE